MEASNIFQPCLHENGLKVADYQQVAAIGSAVNAADQFFIAVIILGGVPQLIHGDDNPSIVYVSDVFFLSMTVAGFFS